MRKWILGAAALVIVVTTPAISQQSSVKPGEQWSAARIDVEEGQYENYMNYLTKTWIPNQEFAKSQGWISGYHVLDSTNPRDGEPDIILITRFADTPSVAEMERRNKIVNERMKSDDHGQDAASGERNKMRKLMGSVLYREVLKR